MKKGTILGREVLILRSDREISDHRPAYRKEGERSGSHDKKKDKFDTKGGKEREPRGKER